MRVKLTRTALDKLKAPPPKSKGGRVLHTYALVWDTELRNFGVRVTSGNTRTYFVQRRIAGVERRITIAKCEVLTPEEARNEARKLLGQIASGVDPLEERAKRIVMSVTLEDVLSAYLQTRRDLKPRTAADMQYAMDALGWRKRRIAQITPEAVEKRHLELGEASHARANLTMRYLRALLNFAGQKYTDAAGRSVMPVNPVQRLTRLKAWFRVNRRRTLVKAHELRAWLPAVLELQNEEARDYLLTVVLTGLRREEALELRWAHVDLEAGTISLPDPKNRKHFDLPVSAYVVDILGKRKKRAIGPYVFQSERGRLSNLRYAIAEVQRVSGVKFCIHDLRRTFMTTTETLRMSIYMQKMLVNHSVPTDVTGAYIVHSQDELRDATQRVTDYILRMGGVRGGAEVIPLRAASGA